MSSTRSLAQPARTTTRNVEQIAERVEAEFDRLKRARPHLLSRIEKAEHILVTHLACKRAGIIKPRVRAGELVGYLVAGSGGAVYKVDPVTFACSCPDHHRRGGTCKHAVAVYALGRAYRKPSPTPPVAPVASIDTARDKKQAQREEWVPREVVFAGLDRMGGSMAAHNAYPRTIRVFVEARAG